MRIIFLLLAVTCGLVPADLAADPGTPGDSSGGLDPTEARFTPANEQGRFRYLVEFARPGLLRSTSERMDDSVADKGRRFDPPFDHNAPEVQAERAALQAYQARQRQAITGTLGRAPEVSHHFLVVNNGLALWLTPEEAEAIARLPQVASVERERLYRIETYHSPWYIGADTVWSGFSTLDGIRRRGEGRVLALLDTGIDPAHPSFANDPACGHGEGDTPDKVLSIVHCHATDADGMCVGDSPIDVHGHGSHVAGIAVGNRLDGASEPPPQLPDEFTGISGMAPCAHVRSYRVCGAGGSCGTAAILAAIANVLVDGDVDALNFSISGGRDPWNDNDRAKLELVGENVLVAVSAGNNPSVIPSAGQVNHRAPWVLSVAASNHMYTIGKGLLSVSGPGAPGEALQDMPVRVMWDSSMFSTGSSFAPDLADFPIRHFDAQPADFEGCTPGEDDGSGQAAPPDMAPFPDGFFTGAAALIGRGDCSSATQIANARDAGAELVIIRDTSSTPWLNRTGWPGVPAYSIKSDAGLVLQAFVSDHPDTARIDLNPFPGDEVAFFSRRGPTPGPLQNLTKPDLIAPGFSVYSAIPVEFLPEGYGPEGYGFLGGTSMSAPHVAGAALLVRQTHPGWSVAEVMSALMTTARRHGFKGIQSTGEGGFTEPWDEPWDADDAGSGRLDVAAAVRAGLVLHESYDNYLEADPDTGGDVRTLNTASLRNMNCEASCSWTRTVRNTLEAPSQWQAVANGEMFEITVEPATFEFTGDPTETRALTITATPLEDNLQGTVNFGEIVFSESTGQSPGQHLTVAIRGRPDQPVVNVDPPRLAVDLGLVQGETRAVTLSNIGELPLEWTLTEQVDPSFITPHSSFVIPEFQNSSTFGSTTAGNGSIDCSNQRGLLVNDTGFVDQGYGITLDEADQVMFMDRYTTPHLLPASLRGACFAFYRRGFYLQDSKDFEIVIYDTDGPDGAPGTELAALPATFEGLMPWSGSFQPNWRGFDLSSLDITVDKGSIYIGARWVPTSTSTSPDRIDTLLGGDGTGHAIPPTPHAHGGGWRWTSPAGKWERLQDVQPNYHALFIRLVIEPPQLGCTRPDWLKPGMTEGIVEPGDDQDLDLVFHTDDLKPGTYYASVCFSTDDPNRALLVLPVVLKLSDQVFHDSFEPGDP